ncbi:chaperonin 10-like protein [Phyllosticta citricarpa]|uniref:Chaperonin 10-like protein n=2 Tax=Phyllosticta TaxID=121621 RepID=A0ABR1LHU5_9PEZI
MASTEPASTEHVELHYDIPAKTKAGVVVNEGPDFRIEVQEVDVPEPGPNDLLLKLSCTGLCMSDVHFMANDWALPKMSEFGVQCAGHEGAGTVVKVGANVKHWRVGDRGGVKPLIDVCGNCELCWDGKENYCTRASYTGLVATGTYQQYIVSPAKYTSPIPPGVPDYVAAPIMCSASTMHRSLIDADLKPASFVVFPGGGGGVGIQGVQLAKAMGHRPIVVDTGAQKKDLALKLGAEAFVDFAEHGAETAEEVKRVCGDLGAHCVIVTAPQAYKNAISYVGNRVGSKIMCVGLPPAGTTKIEAEPSEYIFRNLSIVGTLVGTMKDTAACLDFARRGLLQQIAEVRPLSQMPESVQQLRRGEIAGRVVIDFDQH